MDAKGREHAGGLGQAADLVFEVKFPQPFAERGCARLPPGSRFEKTQESIVQAATLHAQWLRLLIDGIRRNDRAKIAETCRERRGFETENASGKQ